MSEPVFVYVDGKNIIHEIEREPRGDLVNYNLVILPEDRAEQIIDLRQKWQQNANSKKNIFVLDVEPHICQVKKTTYIYYHFKDKTIRAITPRLQENLDDKQELACGLAIVDELIAEFINGTKNMLNYKIDDSGEFLTLEEPEKSPQAASFFESILLIEDFSILSEQTVDTKIKISYKNGTLNIEKIGEIENRKFVLFFVDVHDKTKLHDKVEFSFVEKNSLSIDLNIVDDFFVISPYKKQMTFTKE